MNAITSKGPNYIIIDTNEQIPFSMSAWPEKSPGQPYSKSECIWNGSEVVLKTVEMLESENALKQLPETDIKLSRALEDHVDLLISKGLVSIDDYPEEFQKVYNLKKELRGKLI